MQKQLSLNPWDHLIKLYLVIYFFYKALQRLKKRKKKNRYDKFSKYFYIKAQKAFIKIAKKNKTRYFVLDNSKDSRETEKIILNKFIKVLSK